MSLPDRGLQDLTTDPLPGVPSGRLTPEHINKFIKLSLEDNVLLSLPRPWYKRPMVWMVFFAAVALGAALAWFILAISL